MAERRVACSKSSFILRGDPFSMRRIRPMLSGLLVAGFFLGFVSLPGCGNPEEGSAPKMKGNKDDIDKAFFKQPGNAPVTKKTR
jgi:hypothetical protein